jgi:hypothetical protein
VSLCLNIEVAKYMSDKIKTYEREENNLVCLKEAAVAGRPKRSLFAKYTGSF